MRQFDVFVWGSQFAESSSASITPPFTDPALGWFFGNDLNAKLDESDAEWIVFAHESINIDRTFLNDLALAIEGFPMVDAFAPRVNCTPGAGPDQQKFVGGFLLRAWHGLEMIKDDAPLRFVATPHPFVAAFSKRIIQRTGRLDQSLPLGLSLIDFSLRMPHAGGKMFSLPYLVANKSTTNKQDEQAHGPTTEPYASALSFTLYKNFGFLKNIPYFIAHPSTLKDIWKNRKVLDQKRDAAILLSKLTEKTLKEITCSRAKSSHRQAI